MQGEHEVEVQIWDKDVRYTKSVKDFNRAIGLIRFEYSGETVDGFVDQWQKEQKAKIC